MTKANPNSASPLEGYTLEDIALLKSRATQAETEVQILRELSFKAHQEAATWAAATSQLIRFIGEARLKELGFNFPDPSYMKKFMRLVEDLSKESPNENE